MGKRFTETGKKVFRDNQEGIYYVELNSGMRITVENDAETMACLAWNESPLHERLVFLKNNFGDETDRYEQSWTGLPQSIKNYIIDYQKSKMEIKA